jgi:putative hydrolase of the HAD superfamily
MGMVIIMYDLNIIIDRFIEISKDSIEKEEAFHILFRSDMFNNLETGKCSPEEWHTYLNEQFRINISYDEFENIWNSMFTLNTEIIELYKKLLKNYEIMILSNVGPIHYKHAKETYPIDIIEKHVLSYKEGCMKPDPSIYLNTLKLTDSKPEECIFIDDLKENIIAAQKLGIHGHVFTTAENLKPFLKKKGIMF